MKKALLVLFSIFFITAFSSQETLNTVAEARNYSSGENVVIIGRVTKHISGIDYLFEDDTGSIVVKINTTTWNNMTVMEDDELKIYGSVDGEFIDGPKIWVHRIVKMN